MGKKFKITTLGCKVNQAESESIAQDLLTSEWSAVGDQEQADVCIVNTCTVTQKASMQSRQAVRQAIRAHPQAQLIVTGCYAQIAPQEIEDIPGVFRIVGHDEKQAISSMIKRGASDRSDSKALGCDITLNKRDFKLMPIASTTDRTRPFLKIQDGCDAYCTYCIVPFARGRSRSLALDQVLRGIRQLADAGYHEVVLTGIHIGAYGHDLVPDTNLAALLQRIQDKQLIDRVRLSSIEPFEVTPEILQTVADSDIFCRHFHIPLQSGDNRILQKMGRPYSGRDFKDLIIKIHESMPDAAIGADILIGFPGENETAYEHTYNLVKRLPLSYLHVFPFSARPGTPAAKFKDNIPPKVIKDRCQQMRALGQDKRMNFYRTFVGQTLPLLIETKRDKATGLLKGMSSNYLPVFIDAGDEFKNQIVDVKIEKLEGNRLFGELSD